MIDFLRSLSASLAGFVIGMSVFILWHFRAQIKDRKFVVALGGIVLSAAYVAMDQWSRIGTPPTLRLVLGLGSMSLLGYFLLLSVQDIRRKDS